jgi:hypothetical protein
VCALPPCLQVIGLAFMCVTCGFFFARFAGKCMPKNPDWGEEYGIKFQCSTEGEHNDLVSGAWCGAEL